MGRAGLRAQLKASRQAAVATGAKPAKRVQVNVRPTQWEYGEFVAIDGEGFSDGAEFEYFIEGNGDEPKRYFGREHFYAFISSSEGIERYNPRGRLSLWTCLDFLCGHVERNPRAIMVTFGASYDVTQMVCHDLDREQVQQLLGKHPTRKEKLCVSDGVSDYVLEYRPRKCFTVQRWPAGARRWTLDKNGNRKTTPHLTVRLWDVIGFFQESFAEVLRKWLPGDPDYEFIKRMKGERSIFDRSELEEIRRYNAAENRCLVKVMNMVRDAITDLGLKITRWDGAGAIAAAMMTAEKVKQHKGELPDEVFEAARRAYSGGHIEACRIGYYSGTVHHYDITSAYPDQFRRLPSLQNGEWSSGDRERDGPLVPPAGYTLVKVEFRFPEGLPFYPLFYRCENGTILYPHRGSGWYWFPEFEVASRFFDKFASEASDRAACKFEVVAWHHFRPYAEHSPFGWVADKFRKRADYISAASLAGTVSGPEKIIKLGCNSLYGKTAQQLGARYDKHGELRLPPFFQLDWAGYVTAGCRAEIMSAAMLNPRAIIGFATDGLFSTEPLDLYCPKAKELGAWEYTTHTGITNVMPGVYWLHDGEKVKHYSRGFDKKEMSAVEFVHDGWRKRKELTPVKLTRMISLGSAAVNESYWKMRGAFAHSTRSLRLDGMNSKRYGIDLNRQRPHLGLIDTLPKDHFLGDLFGIPESAPYPIVWIDGALDKDEFQSGDGDMADEMEAMDAENA